MTDRPSEAWRPILADEPAERARAAIDAIAAGLRADPFPPLIGVAATGDRAALYASAGRGRAGLALFFAHLARARTGHDDAAAAATLLAEALAAADPETGLSLYLGATGVAWVATHLRDRDGLPDGEGLCGRVDAAVRASLAAWHRPDQYDLVFGLVGLGVYALERLPDPAAAACLEAVVARLAGVADHHTEGVAWWTAPELLTPPRRRMFPRGCYAVGAAHGAAGVIALLARACAAGVAAARARPLLDRAVAWLLAQAAPDRPGRRFPAFVGPGIEPRPNQFGWCHGDLGVATAVFLAARCVGEPAWEHQALMLAREAAELPAERAGVADAKLCHGAAGVGHLLNRLYQATGEPWLGAAARAWIERALAMRRPGQKIGGFSAVDLGAGGKPERVAYRGFQAGAAGIGLALLAATTAIEPAWDRLLLASAPEPIRQGAGSLVR